MEKKWEEYNRWMENATADADVVAELKIFDDAKIEDAFYRDLAFGTGGLRGVIGAGTNRMNVYTVAKASQGLADYLKKQFESPSVAIGYDSRIKSDAFAKVAAGVFAANGIDVHIWPELMPVPAVSFAVRYLHASAGVMITASHNPARYNGYKVYGADGCQITTEAAAEILAEIDKLDIFEDVKHGKMPDDPVMVKTIVTMDMAERIAAHYGLRTINVLTGFKFIGEQIGKLEELYKIYGYCLNTLHSYEFDGSAGFAKMQNIMQTFRGEIKEFGGKKVVEVLDYTSGLDGLPKSDVLKFLLEDHCSIVVRPSGTEPKLKMYISVSAENKEAAEVVEAEICESAEKNFILCTGGQPPRTGDLTS